MSDDSVTEEMVDAALSEYDLALRSDPRNTDQLRSRPGVLENMRKDRQAGIKGGSSHSGRRTLAAKVLAATGDVDTVQVLLGHAHLDHSKPYLTVDQATIRRAFEIAL